MHAFFIFLLDGNMCSALGSKETAHSNNGWAQRQLQRDDDRKCPLDIKHTEMRGK